MTTPDKFKEEETANTHGQSQKELDNESNQDFQRIIHRITTVVIVHI